MLAKPPNPFLRANGPDFLLPGRFALSSAQRKDAVAATTALPPLIPVDREIGFHDRVRVPDGRTGNVIGFYRTATETALVLLDAGESRQFVLSELALAAHD